MKKTGKPDPFLIDDENPEWTAEDFAAARPAREVMPPEFFDGMAALREKRLRGRPRKVAPKPTMTFRFDPTLAEAIRALGRGYNTRVENVLRRAFETETI